ANCYRDLIASGAYSYRRFMHKFGAGLMAAGVRPGSEDRMLRQVSEWLTGGQQALLTAKLMTQRTEYHELLATDVALQEQYMTQQRQLQQLLDQHRVLVVQHAAVERQQTRRWWKARAVRALAAARAHLARALGR